MLLQIPLVIYKCYKREEQSWSRHRGDGDVKIGRDCNDSGIGPRTLRQPPEAGRDKDGCLSQSPLRGWPCWLLISSLPNCERIIFCCLKLPSLWQFLQQSQETNMQVGKNKHRISYFRNIMPHGLIILSKFFSIVISTTLGHDCPSPSPTAALFNAAATSHMQLLNN